MVAPCITMSSLTTVNKDKEGERKKEKRQLERNKKAARK